MEKERPCCYTECCDAETSWEEYGMRIKWTEPAVPGTSQVAMVDPLSLTLCLECKKPVPIRNVTAFAWTHVYHKDNPEGIFREIPLIYNPNSRKWDDWGVTTYLFSTIIYPTHNDDFRLTYNVKFGRIMIWANLFQIDHTVTVTPALEVNMWTNTPRLAQITQNIYLGNYLAAMLAEEHNFDAILNLHTGTEARLNKEPGVIKTFLTIDLQWGAGNPVEPVKIQHIVDWLMAQNSLCQKILIGDREGLGRVGSAMTAYIFANNRNLTFEESYAFVQSRMFLYCHKGLKDVLYELYPRD